MTKDRPVPNNPATADTKERLRIDTAASAESYHNGHILPGGWFPSTRFTAE